MTSSSLRSIPRVRSGLTMSQDVAAVVGAEQEVAREVEPLVAVRAHDERGVPVEDVRLVARLLDGRMSVISPLRRSWRTSPPYCHWL
jgi:hypothetical protein